MLGVFALVLGMEDIRFWLSNMKYISPKGVWSPMTL